MCINLMAQTASSDPIYMIFHLFKYGVQWFFFLRRASLTFILPSSTSILHFFFFVFFVLFFLLFLRFHIHCLFESTHSFISVHSHIVVIHIRIPYWFKIIFPAIYHLCLLSNCDNNDCVREAFESSRKMFVFKFVSFTSSVSCSYRLYLVVLCAFVSGCVCERVCVCLNVCVCVCVRMCNVCNVFI